MSNRKTAKKLLFISRKAPYGCATAKECLDALLAASAYEQDLGLLFMGDGVFQLKKEQQPEAGRQKNISATLPVLSMYDIKDIYLQASALAERGLTADDLVIPVKALNNNDIRELMEQQDQLLSF
jgi:tRNA 2-thiouridine synthesizing protein C